jgi:hypothetical protein
MKVRKKFQKKNRKLLRILDKQIKGEQDVLFSSQFYNLLVYHGKNFRVKGIILNFSF